MKIVHHNDIDGRASAAIVFDWVQKYSTMIKGEDIEFIEMDYKDTLDISRINPGEKIAILDFSFKPEVMAQIRTKTTDIVWCDHHQTARDYGYVLPGVRDFKDKGLSGCECTWNFCYQAEPPLAVRLIGDYDAWRLEMTPDCFEFYEGLKLEDIDPRSPRWGEIIFGNEIYDVKVRGRTAILYRDNYCANIGKTYGYETEIDGIKAYAMNLYAFGSRQFGEKMKDYPICIAYIHDGSKYTVSLYSTLLDVSVTAKLYGGGGHRGAAGFVCERLPFKKGI